MIGRGFRWHGRVGMWRGGQVNGTGDVQDGPQSNISSINRPERGVVAGLPVHQGCGAIGERRPDQLVKLFPSECRLRASHRVS